MTDTDDLLNILTDTVIQGGIESGLPISNNKQNNYENENDENEIEVEELNEDENGKRGQETKGENNEQNKEENKGENKEENEKKKDILKSLGDDDEPMIITIFEFCSRLEYFIRIIIALTIETEDDYHEKCCKFYNKYIVLSKKTEEGEPDINKLVQLTKDRRNFITRFYNVSMKTKVVNNKIIPLNFGIPEDRCMAAKCQPVSYITKNDMMGARKYFQENKIVIAEGVPIEWFFENTPPEFHEFIWQYIRLMFYVSNAAICTLEKPRKKGDVEPIVYDSSHFMIVESYKELYENSIEEILKVSSLITTEEERLEINVLTDDNEYLTTRLNSSEETNNVYLKSRQIFNEIIANDETLKDDNREVIGEVIDSVFGVMQNDKDIFKMQKGGGLMGGAFNFGKMCSSFNKITKETLKQMVRSERNPAEYFPMVTTGMRIVNKMANDSKLMKSAPSNLKQCVSVIQSITSENENIVNNNGEDIIGDDDTNEENNENNENNNSNDNGNVLEDFVDGMTKGLNRKTAAQVKRHVNKDFRKLRGMSKLNNNTQAANMIKKLQGMITPLVNVDIDSLKDDIQEEIINKRQKDAEKYNGESNTTTTTTPTTIPKRTKATRRSRRK